MVQVTKIADLSPEEIDLDALNVESLSDSELDILERKIASRYLNIVPWGAVAWAFTNLFVWLSLWPLVLLDLLPLWLAFPIAVLNCCLAYLPSHEAQHNIIASKGRPLRWLNELVGHISTIPLALPYRVMKHTHMQHHAHANDPTLDPDYSVHARNGWDYLVQNILRRQPGGARGKEYPAALKRIKKAHMIRDAVFYNFVFLTVLFACAWTGHAVEAALIWWIPKYMAGLYISYYLSWKPHHPGVETGRYRDTRGFKSRVGNILSMGMQYHIVHHLYPRIPLMKTPAAYRDLKPILERRGCDLGRL